MRIVYSPTLKNSRPLILARLAPAWNPRSARIVCLRIQELESCKFQDEVEDFFNSLDPESWEHKNKDGSFILAFRL